MAYIELSRNSFAHNIAQIARKTGGIDKISLVVKDNAYGHGALPVAQLAKECGIKHVVVRNIQESVLLRHDFESILVLADVPETRPESHIHIVVNSLEAIASIPEGTSVELKIDTGMHRNGIDPEDFETAVERIGAASLTLKGVMTHHRSADELGSEFFWQKRRFDALRERGVRLGLGNLRWHSCNSAALFRHSAFDEDVARVGIAAYGCLEMPAPFKQPDLKPVLSLFVEKIAQRNVRQGMCVGYGGTGTPEEGVLSTYDLGYGDGWRRTAYTLPSGKPVIGRISMDNMSIQSDAPALCLMNDAREAARQTGTISYEVLVRLASHLKRVIR